MASSETALEDLRRKIDRVDDAIHDLLIQRVSIVQWIGQAKREGGPRFRPAREAKMLRRLMARHQGRFPKTVLARIWREMLGATVGLQGEFSIGVFATDREPGVWELARNHFGTHAPIVLHASIGQIVSDVAGGKATLGVLPRPAEDERQPWWPLLAHADAATPRVIARLPFAGRARGRAENVEAVIIGRQEPEDSGDDMSLIATETDDAVSRATLKSLLVRSGLEPAFFAPWQAPNRPGLELTLIEVKGYVAADDKRLAKLVDQTKVGVSRVLVIGCYAQPLAERALADR